MNLSHQKYDCGCASAARDRVLDLTRPDNRPQRRKKGSLRDKSPATEPTLTKLLDRPLRRRLHGGVGSTFPAVRKEAVLQAAEDTRQPSRRRKSAGPNIKALLIALLASVVFAAGCGGSEETQSGSAEETTTDHEATKKSKESTEGRGSDREITLSLEGDAGTGFSGTCSVGDEEESFEGQVPKSFSYELGGRQLECEIQKQDGSGTLEVLLTGPGDRVRQQTDDPGGTIKLTYSENGSASSSSSSSVSSSSVNQVVSNSSSGSSFSSSSSKSSR